MNKRDVKMNKIYSLLSRVQSIEYRVIKKYRDNEEVQINTCLKRETQNAAELKGEKWA